MFNQFDAAMKTLLKTSPASWLKLAGIVSEELELLEDEDFQFEETDLTTVTAACDQVLRSRKGNSDLYHVEFESEGRNVPKRVLRYNVLISYKYGVPVRSIVFLLREEADSKEITGQFRQFASDGELYLDFRFIVVRIWLIPTDLILESGIGTLPLAIVSKVTESELPAVVQRMQERVDQELAPDERSLFWTTSYLLLGLNYPIEFVDNLLRGKDHMKNSSTYMGILEKGKEIGILQGKEIGIEQGKEEYARDTIFRIGERRFGKPDRAIVEKIESVHSLETLTSLVDRLTGIETWDELFRS